FRLSGAYYDYRISNLVERYLIGTSNFYFRNRGAARIRGAELEMQARMGRGLVLELSWQVSHGRDDDVGTPLDDIAPQLVAVAVRHAMGTRFTSYVRVAAVSRHEAAGPSEVPTPGFVTLDAGAAWRWSSRVDVR